MTEPQRHKLVISAALAMAVCLVLYLIMFGFHSFDPKGWILFVGFFVVAAKLATVKHKHNPMI
jgi:hypothetical protein